VALVGDSSHISLLLYLCVVGIVDLLTPEPGFELPKPAFPVA